MKEQIQLSLYMKFLNQFMYEDKLDKITILDTETFKEYYISRVALDEDDQLYIEALDKSLVTREIYLRLIKDYLVSRLIDQDLRCYSFLEDETLYAISIDSSNKLIMETYKRTLYEEILEISLDKR